MLCCVVEYEYHALFHCQNEEIVRAKDKFIRRCYRIGPSHLKYILLLQNDNEMFLNNLASLKEKVFAIFR